MAPGLRPGWSTPSRKVETLSDRTPKSIPLNRAVLGGIALLSAGIALGLMLGEMSGPSLASAPNPPLAKPGELTNSAPESPGPMATAPLADLARGSQERDGVLPSTAPLEIGQPLPRTGPLGGLFAASAGMMPLPTGQAETLNDRVALVLGAGTPTPESLEQMVMLVNAAPPSAIAPPSPIVSVGGPTTTRIPGPLPPPIYEGVNKASLN